MITEIKKNIMGTIDFTGKFGKMRKADSFIVYPFNKDSNLDYIQIQSGKRYGIISISKLKLLLSVSGSYPHNLDMDIATGKALREAINPEELEALVVAIRATASASAGNNGIVVCDNSKASAI